MSFESRRFSAALSAIVVSAFLLRLAAILWIPTRPVSDFFWYRSFSLDLLRSGELPPVSSILGPGYPMWLAGVAKLFGDSLLAARLANCALSAATVGIAGVLGRVLFGRAAGLLAAGLLCLDPRQILQTGLLASENFSAPLTFAFLLLVALSWRKADATPVAVPAGILLGLAALTRPVTWPLLFLWPLTASFVRKRFPRVLKETAVLAAVLFAMLLPWGAWNHRRNHRWLFTNSGAGTTLYKGNHAGASGGDADWRPSLRAAEPVLELSDPNFSDRVAAAAARAWIGAHPLGALHLYVRKLELYLWKIDPVQVAYWTIRSRGPEPPAPPIEVLPGHHFLKDHFRDLCNFLREWYRASVAAGFAAVLVFVIRVRHASGRIRMAGFVLVLGACAIFPLVTSVFIALDRYRWPFEDLLCVLISSLAATREAPAASGYLP